MHHFGAIAVAQRGGRIRRAPLRLSALAPRGIPGTVCLPSKMGPRISRPGGNRRQATSSGRGGSFLLIGGRLMFQTPTLGRHDPRPLRVEWGQPETQQVASLHITGDVLSSLLRHEVSSDQGAGPRVGHKETDGRNAASRRARCRTARPSAPCKPRLTRKDR